MKKIGLKAGIQIMALILLTGCGCGRSEQLGMTIVGPESAENTENSEQMQETEQEEQTTEEQTTEEQTTEEQTTEEQTPEEVQRESEDETESDADGGGNEFSAQEQEVPEGNCISILVSENKYYYNNAVMELEAIVEMVNEAGEDVYVEIRDEEAAHREYSALIDRLEELEVSYIEIIE